ncbi:hypothetical protein [Adhaeribacter aquaticus]|uniref:hypothetical protein n=1 Tax=Adhaeribacter aquaticus TaxID=299567 RepID=UPI0004100E52|nr:hypothetical protein [Adhaeribacter aquaticus]
MTKRFLTVAFVACSLYLVSCSSEPSDLRPGKKVSVDAVPPGTRDTPNLDNAEDKSAHDKQQDVQLNHDEHANEISNDTKNKDVTQEEKTQHKQNVENHN